MDAIQTGAAIFPLSGGGDPRVDRGFLRITGPDATRWLNGMVTNNVAGLAPGQGNYNFLLNAQGRIQGDCTIYRSSDTNAGPTFLLETDASQIDTIHPMLDKFIIMDDVELTRLGSRTGLGVIGPKALSMLQASDIMSEDADQNELVPISWHASTLELMRCRDTLVPTYELWADPATGRKLYESLTAAGACQVNPEAVEAHRILAGRPRYGTDLRNTDTAKDLPQETGQTHALHFAKGCYLGQEIVERIHSRGQVHRNFTQFVLSGEKPELPTVLTSNGKAAGELTSAASIPLPGGPVLVALGYARRDALDGHFPLTYAGGVATPTSPEQILRTTYPESLPDPHV